jgi:hypothetical protein
MKKIIAVSLLVLLSTNANAKRLHKERYYQDITCDEIGGVVEYRLPDRTRVDCLTEEYATEFDFSSKWTEAIGQSLHYARMTGKKAGIYLILEKKSDNKYYDRLMDNIKFYDLPIDVFPIRVYEGE